MSRIDWRPGLVAAGLALVGCGRATQAPEPGEASRKTAPAPTAAVEASTAPAGLFADWKGLQAAIVVTGEMDGYLDPCGCTDGQLGGLGRRFDLLARMDAQKIPSARIDLGALTKEPNAARGGIEQAKVKFETALTALQMMKYDAVALAPEDLRFGVFQTMGVYLNVKDKLHFVAANVAPSKELGETFAGIIRPSAVAKAGPYKVGVTSVVDPDWYKALKDPDLATLEVRAPEAALPEVLKRLEEESDVQVLMVQGPPERAKALGKAFPGFEIVVSTSPYPDPDGRPEAINDGTTQVIMVGQQGKYVGVVGLLKPAKGTAPTIRYRQVALDGQKYRNAEPMRALIDESMQRTLKDLAVVENFPRGSNASAPPGSTYVGAEGCRSCHENTYAKWLGTNHARAYEVLAHNPKDPRRNREYDAECIACHTTGFVYKSGWVSPEKTPYLKGNQCENCHGPASKHVEQPDNQEFRKALARTPERADKGGLCLSCHDAENSRHYSFETYYPKIAHKGLDKYDAPRVHRGMTPEQARAAK